jgi:uncharacterized phage-associated protein
VPALYREYKSYGADEIPSPQELDFSKCDQEMRDLLHEVYAGYGPFAVWKLPNMSHQEPPWCMTLEGQEITHASLTKEAPHAKAP